MKLIVAVIHPEELAPIQAALDRLGVWDVSVGQVFVNCKEEAYTLIYRSATIPVHHLLRLKLEIVVDDYLTPATVEALENACLSGATGPAGTRKIYVRHLEETPSRFGGKRVAISERR